MNGYINTLQEYKNAYEQNPTLDIKPFIKKLIVYGLKAVNANRKTEYATREDAESAFQFAELIKSFMSLLTPKEFINIFPINKDFKGHKWQAKDYFYTRNYIETLEQSKPIGEKITDFLWEYTNIETETFLARLFSIADDIRHFDGYPGMMEEFLNDNGVKTYTMHTDNKGNGFLFDNETGKTMKVKKPKPRYLKVVRT